MKTCKYVGSFPVAGSDQPTRADYVRAQLEQIRENKKRKPVLLVISLAGIKVCSPDGKNVFMAHALRRISYATCDAENCQFSFLAREPKGHFSLQYCHSFITESPDQAEELNTIVGNAFRMAYVAQLQKQQHKHPQQAFNNGNQCDVQPYAVAYSPVHHGHHRFPSHCDNNHFASLSNHSSPASEKRRSSNNSSPARNLNTIRSDWVKQSSNTNLDEFKNVPRRGSDQSIEMNMLSSVGSSPYRHRQMDEANGNLLVSDTTKMKGFPEKPHSLPGLHSHRIRASQSSDELLTPSSVSSDDANSPTEMNSYKRLVDKPPLIKRLALTERSPEEELRPLVKDSTGENIRTPSSDGYVNEGLGSQSSDSLATDSQNEEQPKLFVQISSSTSPVHGSKLNGLKRVGSVIPSPLSSEAYMDQSSDGSKRSSRSSEGQASPLLPESLFIQDPKESSGYLKGDPKVKRISQTSVASTCSSSNTPPPPPESRYDSLQTNYSEEKELRKAPWFQAGIPREIALEILGHEPIGAFMVRESTSKPGCYALSLRVPREFQPTGIAHYLIMRTNKGYKIKGFTKEFVTLTALITHHSVMPELLPCPLCLSRYNPNFAKHDSNQDFADMDDDPDYNTLADFRKMMADLSV